MYKLIICLDDNYFYFEDTYTDETELCNVVNVILSEQDMNNGCHFASIEDVFAANSVIAEKTGDINNLLNFIEIEEL